MPLFEYKKVDKEFYEREIKDFLPEHIIDAVTVQTGAHGITPSFESTGGHTWRNIIHQTEKQILEKSLQDHHGNITQTANALGISRQSLQYLLRKHKLNKGKGD